MLYDLVIGMPVWYGADIIDFKKCLNSIYSAFSNINEEYKNNKIKFIIGIDNIPEFEKNKENIEKFEKNIGEIKDTILFFKNSVEEITNCNIKVDFFITEYNVRLSVMRNTMISLAGNSKYINFLDHDDKIPFNTFNVFLKNIEENYNKGVFVLYFKIHNSKTNGNSFLSFPAWGNLYNTHFLITNNISFIPGIPMEDRFFRRELELYLLDEEQKNIDEFVYVYDQASNSCFLKKNNLEITRQEMYKKMFYTSLKPKVYSFVKRGMRYYFYDEINYLMEKNPKIKKEEYYFYFLNRDNHFVFDDYENFKFPKITFNIDCLTNKIVELTPEELSLQPEFKLFNFVRQNHFALHFINLNDKKKLLFCKNILKNEEITTNHYLNKLVNILVELMQLKSGVVIFLIHYLNQNYENEDIKFILSKFIDTNDNICDYSKIIADLDNNIRIELKNSAENLIKRLLEIRKNEIINSIQENDFEKLNNILNIDDNIDLTYIDYNNLNNDFKLLIDKYLYQQAYKMVNKEQLIELQNLVEKFPFILEIKDNKGVCISNLACRNQCIESGLEFTIRSYFNKDKNKIIAFLFKKNSDSFNCIDNFGKTAFDFLLVEYADNLKINNKLENKKISIFIEVVKNLFDYFKTNDYKLIPYLRYIYLDLENCRNLKDLKYLQEVSFKYINEEIIKYNLIEYYKNKDYKAIANILLQKQGNAEFNLGVKEFLGFLDIVYINYTTFRKITKLKIYNNETIIDVSKYDLILKDILLKLLAETIFGSLMYKTNVDPVDKIIISRIREALNILYDKNNNLSPITIEFDFFYKNFLNSSDILQKAINIKQNNQIKTFKNINLKYLQEKIDNIKNSNKNNIEKIYEFLKVLDDSL